MGKNKKSALADRVIWKSLGEMLVTENRITAEQLDNALELERKNGRKLSEILVDQGLATAEDLAMVRSIQLNVPLIDLKQHQVQPEALELITEDTARKHTLIPLKVVDNSLTVVMADPQDIITIEDIKAQSGMRVEVAIGIPSDIQQAIDLNYRSSGEIKKQISQFAPAFEEEAEVTPERIARTPITETLDLLIAQAVRDRASDIHLELQDKRLRIRYRIDGILHDVFSLPLSTHAPLVSRVKILAEMNISEQRRPQEGQLSLKVGDRDVDIRAAVMPTVYGERVALRILDKSLSLFTLPELGLLPDAFEKYRAMLKSPFGMILVAGPTGSGKTTTLYASINHLVQNESNIMTIEDPIEYNFTDINQIQVNPKAGITFSSGLRAIMRHDPDIILVGEIRDKDTARTAVQAALTGHLVLSSIHANDAVGVLFRLMDLGVEPHLISPTLVGVVAQRMVRRICTHCRAKSQPSAEEQTAYHDEMRERANLLYRGAGCNFCSNTGFRGRTALFEIMTMSEDIRRILLDSASAPDIKAQALKEGMITLRRDGMLKVKEGVTLVSEVLRSVFSIG